MAWTDTQDLIQAGYGVLRLTPLTMNGTITTQIDSFGTKEDYSSQTKGEETFTVVADAEKVNKEKVLANGTTVRIEVTDAKTINAATGEEVAADATKFDKVQINALVGITLLDNLIDIGRAGDPLVVSTDRGIDAQSTVLGWEHMIGKLIDDIVYTRADDLFEVVTTITGGTAYTALGTVDETDFNTAVTTAGFTPVGKTIITLKGLTNAEWLSLLTGIIVRTDLA